MNITEIEDTIEDYTKQVTELNNYNFTNELYKELERHNPVLDEQINFYIDYVNRRIHYFNYYLGRSINNDEDLNKMKKLIKHRIKLMLIRCWQINRINKILYFRKNYI
jgi:hypothetical protein